MKIYCDGAKFYGSQIQAIEKGFKELGHEVTEFISDADLIYSNNPSQTRAQIVKDKELGQLKPGAKLIFCILDYPKHLEVFQSFQDEIPEIKRQLAAADAVVSISEYTQKSVKEYYGFDSTVIYNPMKVIKPYEKSHKLKPYKYLHVGRRSDFNKNFNKVAEALMLLGIGEEELGLVGHEMSWGSYIGVLSDEDLANQYLAAEYVFSLGEIEGLSLTVVESMAAGAIPIIHRDLSTKEELLPRKLFPEYDAVFKDSWSIAGFIHYLEKFSVDKQNLKERLIYHYNTNLKDKFTSKSVASKIIKVYNNIK